MPRNESPSELEAALQRIEVAPAQIDRDALMFAAGRASATRSLSPQLWQGAACLATAACVALLATGRGDPRVPTRETAPIDVIAAPLASEWPLDGRLAIRPVAVVNEQLDAIAPIPENDPPRSTRRLLNELLIDLKVGDDV